MDNIMKMLLSFSAWLEFLDTAFDAIFPVICILLVFTLFNRKAFKENSSPLRLFLVLVIMALGLRMSAYFLGIKFSRRYLFLLAAYGAILAAPGIFSFAGLLEKLSKYIPALTPRRALILAFVIAGAICAGKGLNPRFDKEWMFQIPELIKSHTPEGKKPVLVSNFGDVRPAYYAGADYMKLSSAKEDFPYIKINDQGDKEYLNFKDCIFAVPGKREFAGKWFLAEVPYEHGVENFGKNLIALEKSGKKVFVLIFQDTRTDGKLTGDDDCEFKKIFAEQNISFPLHFLKRYHDHKGRPLIIYELNPEALVKSRKTGK